MSAVENLVTEEEFPCGLKCRACHGEVLFGETYRTRPYPSPVFTREGVITGAHEIICTACDEEEKREGKEAA